MELGRQNMREKMFKRMNRDNFDLEGLKIENGKIVKEITSEETTCFEHSEVLMFLDDCARSVKRIAGR